MKEHRHLSSGDQPIQRSADHCDTCIGKPDADNWCYDCETCLHQCRCTVDFLGKRHLFIRPEDQRALQEAARKRREQVYEDLTMCPICNERPIWLNGQCRICFEETSN